MAEAPALAFLIPSRDRHGDLAANLPGVLRAASRVGAEVIVCDQSARPYPVPAGVRLLHVTGLSGLPAARNRLLAATRADVVCFLDDDTAIAGDFAQRLVAHAQAEPGLLGWGAVVEVRPRRLRSLYRVVHLGSFRDPRRFTGCRLDAPTPVLFGCCMAFRRSVVSRIGFDERLPGYALGEDFDFCHRIVRHFGPGCLRFCADLKAIHHRSGTNRGEGRRLGLAKATFLLRHARRYGAGNPCTLLHLAIALAAACRTASPAGIMEGLFNPGRI